MLKKLMKYDLRWIIGKVLLYYTAATAFTAVLARLLSEMKERSTALTVISGFALGLFFSSAIPLVINAFMRSLVRMRQTFYKDEAYLTHTLPIRRSTVFTAKVFASGISLLYSLAVALLGAAFVYLTHHDVWQVVKETLQTSEAKYAAAMLAVVAVLELLFMQLCATLGMVCGHRKRRARTPFSVLYAVLIYFACSLLIFAACYLVSLAIPDLHHTLFEVARAPMGTVVQLQGARQGLALLAALYVLADVSLFFLGRRIFCKGVDVE